MQGGSGRYADDVFGFVEPESSGQTFPFGFDTADLTMDAEACTFTLDGWQYSTDALPDAVPSGGTVAGQVVRLDGSASRWSSCTGGIETVEHTLSTGQLVQGYCDDFDGPADFTLTEGYVIVD